MFNRKKKALLYWISAFFMSVMVVFQVSLVQAGESWKQSNEKWYYVLSSGEYAKGWKEVAGKWYYFDGSGAMVTDWRQLGNKWYYFDGSGAMVTDWRLLGNKWYYFDGSGAMVTDWRLLGNKWYYFDGSGAMVTDWRLLGNKWYYFDGSGAMATGWKSIDGDWYYFADSGRMYSSEWVNGIYYMSSSGQMMVNTWTEDGYWVDEKGVFEYISIVYSKEGCQIPYINIYSEEIKALNQRIYDVYYAYINGYNEHGEYCYETDIETGIKNGILSLVITSQHSPGGNSVVNVYNVDLTNRVEAYYEQVLGTAGYTNYDIYSLLTNGVSKEYKRRFTGFMFDQGMYEKTMDPENLRDYQVFINEDQHLSVVVTAYVPAGAGETPFVVDLER